MKNKNDSPVCRSIKHLMVVEDEALFRNSLKLTLQKNGYKVSMARDGREALDIAASWKKRQDRPDLLVTDIDMPRLDGFGLLEELERQKLRIPTLAITAYGDKDTLVKLMRKNVCDYLDKPFTPEEFLSRIDKLCKNIEQNKKNKKDTREIERKKEEEKKKLEAHRLQARKMEALGTLAGGIAHDFNNVLSAIIGFTELAMKELPESSSPRQKMVRVHEAAERATDLVRQILTFSRVSNEEHTPLDVGPVVKEALLFLRSSLPTTIDIKEDIPSHLPQVKGNPTQIHQVLMNLATNALHAMEKSGGRLEVSLSEARFNRRAPEAGHAGPGAFLEIRVRDTGVGIDKEAVQRIFEPYFTTKNPGKGTGMGLAVVHGIVKGHGGSIKVYSEPGNGTVFTVYLPVYDGAAEDQTVEEACVSNTGTERILVVDDEPDIVFIYRELLEELGYKVEARTSSTEALDVFRQNPGDFDLVVTDQTMPHMTGLKLGKEIARIRPDIPVILCSGFGDIVSRSEADTANIKYQYKKPLRCDEFARIVRNVINDSCNHQHAQTGATASYGPRDRKEQS